MKRLEMNVIGVAMLLFGMAGGCASVPFMDGALGPHCPVRLVPSDEIPDGFRVTQHMRFTTEEGTTRVEVSATARDGRLEIEGTSPLGTRAVRLIQDGRKTRIDNASGRFMGIHPYLVLDALHRSLFVPSSGEWDDEQIVETEPRPGERRRSFYATEDDNVASLGVRIVYEKGDPALRTKPATRIENRWCGYDALILTVYGPVSGAPASSP